VRSVERLLAPSCPTRADDPDHVVISFRPDDQNQAAPDWTNGNESVFDVRMSFVENFEMIDIRYKKLARLFK